MDNVTNIIAVLTALLADPQVWAFAASIGGTLVGLFRLIGVEDAARRMERLHSAVQTVADASVKRGLSASDAAMLLWQHLLTANADTMRKLAKDATPQVLGTMLEAKIGKAVAHAGPDLIASLGKDAAVFANVAAEVEAIAARGFSLPSPVVVRAMPVGRQIMPQGWQAQARRNIGTRNQPHVERPTGPKPPQGL